MRDLMLSIDTRKDIERRALEITAQIEEKCGRFEAEVVPGCSPNWHLIATFPNKEDYAAEFLMDRGLGVFVARFEDHGRR
jgi:hypothetical protein